MTLTHNRSDLAVWSSCALCESAPICAPQSPHHGACRWTSRACRLSTGALPMANASSLKGLMTFLRRDEWRKPFTEIQHTHFFVLVTTPVSVPTRSPTFWANMPP